MTFSCACADCEGTEACPGEFVAETEDQVWMLVELPAKLNHAEYASGWGDKTRAHLKSQIKAG